LHDRSEYAPFIGALGLFVTSFLGVAISLCPMIVPWHFTLDQAAASESTQAFLLIGTLFLLPIILLYTALVLLGVSRQGAGRHRLSLRDTLRGGAPNELYPFECSRAMSFPDYFWRRRRGFKICFWYDNIRGSVRLTELTSVATISPSE
jgi:Cytochrome bd terminal oxidase subunit II